MKVVFPSLPLLRAALLLLQNTGNSFRIAPKPFWLQFLLSQHPTGRAPCCWDGWWLREMHTPQGNPRDPSSDQDKRNHHNQAHFYVSWLQPLPANISVTTAPHQRPLMQTRTGSGSAAPRDWHWGDHPTALPRPNEAIKWKNHFSKSTGHFPTLLRTGIGGEWIPAPSTGKLHREAFGEFCL